MVSIKLLDIFDLNWSRGAASGLTGIKYIYLHMSQNLTGTCLYQIRVDSKDTMIKTFKMFVQHSYKYSGLLVIYINSLWINTDVYIVFGPLQQLNYCDTTCILLLLSQFTRLDRQKEYLCSQNFHSSFTIAGPILQFRDPPSIKKNQISKLIFDTLLWAWCEETHPGT